MVKQESPKHHYVPEFLLRAWACRGTLNGYWWDARRGALACRGLGPKAFCRELDLLLLERHPEGRDALENKFFGGVTRAAHGLESESLKRARRRSARKSAATSCGCSSRSRRLSGFTCLRAIA